MVRHYYMRRSSWQADVRINLAPKSARAQSSHQIALRVRPELEKVARAHNVRMKIVEMPPGPPVLQTIVAEIYGPPQAEYAQVVAYGRELRPEDTGIALEGSEASARVRRILKLLEGQVIAGSRQE